MTPVCISQQPTPARPQQLAWAPGAPQKAHARQRAVAPAWQSESSVVRRYRRPMRIECFATQEFRRRKSLLSSLAAPPIAAITARGGAVRRRCLLTRHPHQSPQKVTCRYVISGHNYKIRRAAAPKAIRRYQDAVLCNIECRTRNSAKITTLEEYNELINRLRETARATHEEK